jgi:hypothetical protein
MKTSFTIVLLFFFLTFKGFSQENVLISSNENVSILEVKKPENLFDKPDKLPLSMTRNFWGTRRFYEGDNEISNQEFAGKLALNQDTKDLLCQSNKDAQYGNIAAGVSLIALIGSYATIPKDSRYFRFYDGKSGWVITYFTSIIVSSFWHLKGQGNFQKAVSFYNERYASNTTFDSNVSGLTLSLRF